MPAWASLPALRWPSPTTVPSASAQIVMVEGRVTAESGSNLTIVTPAEGMYCKPTLMCAHFLRAPGR